MGNTSSSENDDNNNDNDGPSSSGMLCFLQRTWTVMVTERWTRSRVACHQTTEISDCLSDYDSDFSQYTFCSCSQCQRDDGFSSGCYSELFESGSSSSVMAPNSEDSARIGQFPFIDDGASKEKQRPPIYNPEDYAISLKKWGRKSPNGGNVGGNLVVSLYNSTSTSDLLENGRGQSNSFRDYRNPMLISSGSEMTLRQFGTVSELLAKLKSDLRLAYPSFVQEFVSDPLDGITLLLDLLRAIQLSQSNNHGNPGGTNTTGKVPPAVQRRALLDELSCLQCLYNCCTRYSEAVRKLTSSSAGLFTLAICIMSNVNKSRIIALQLLTKACDPQTNGHSAVSEALSTLRLRFGEPVRFRFLVGILTSTGGQRELIQAGMKFLNRFLDTAGMPQKRLYIQAELEQAGFDSSAIRKNIGKGCGDQIILEELDRWEKNHINVEKMAARIEDVERENDSLRDKITLLDRRVQILQEEKGVLISLEQCLKERCSELQGEVTSLKSEKSPKISTIMLPKDGSTPAEDEGISSSERSLTPEDDIQRESSVYELYSIQSETIPIASKTGEDEEEETTIDEVIEELRNIINDAETEVYVKEDRRKLDNERKKIEEAQVAGKLQIKLELVDDENDENEIIPSNLHPQPPRKARSLVHLFIPAEDYDYCPNNSRELFFENETAYTSEEGSDSLLSASKCHLPRLENHRVILDIKESRKIKRNPSKTSIKRSESFRHVSKPITEPLSYYKFKPESDNRLKSKSLDRIDDGLDSMVDIVVTDHKVEKYQNGQIFGSTTSRAKLSTHSEEKQRMFLPPQRDYSSGGEIPYYFPRIQESKCSSSSSFLIRRGHTNAGLYSGQIIREASSRLEGCMGGLEYGTNCRTTSRGKVTDLPSGLY